METRSQKDHANVEIYLMTVADKAVGLAVIASEPRRLTIVNIIGSIDLEKLHKLEGRFGVPKLDIGTAKSPGCNQSRTPPCAGRALIPSVGLIPDHCRAVHGPPLRQVIRDGVVLRRRDCPRMRCRRPPNASAP